MALRHRVPTVFSIYMVDVLCCALGCVILLWQVNYQEAEKQTAAAHARGDDLQNSLDKLKNAHLSINSLESALDASKKELSQSQKDLAASQKKGVEVTLLLDDKLKALAATERLALVRKKEYDALKETHELAQAALDKFRGANKELEVKTNLTASELADKIKANAELLLKIAAAQGRVKALEKDL